MNQLKRRTLDLIKLKVGSLERMLKYTNFWKVFAIKQILNPFIVFASVFLSHHPNHKHICMHVRIEKDA